MGIYAVNLSEFISEFTSEFKTVTKFFICGWYFTATQLNDNSSQTFQEKHALGMSDGKWIIKDDVKSEILY